MDQVSEELRAARAMTYAVSRVSALTKLLLRLTPLDRLTIIAEILATTRAFENPYLQVMAFLELLPHLEIQDKSKVLAEAARATRDISDRGMRSLLFAHLAPLLPEHDRTFALIEAWLGTARLKAESPAEALIEFTLKRQQSERQEIFEEMLDAAQELRDADIWLGAMKPIVRHLPEPLLQSVAKASRGLWAQSARIESLLKLAADLSELSQQSILTEAILVARSETEPGSRAHGLHLVSLAVAGTERKELLGETLEAVRAIRSADEQTRALARLLPDLPAELLEEGFGIVLAIKKINSRARAIVELVPLLPESFQERVISTVRQMKPRGVRVETLLALSRVKPRQFLNELRNEVLAIPDVEHRAKTLVQIARLSGESERLSTLILAARTARLINDSIPKARLLIEMATDLPVQERNAALRDALSTVQSIEPKEQRVEALKQLAWYVPRQTFAAFLELVQSTTDLVSPGQMLKLDEPSISLHEPLAMAERLEQRAGSKGATAAHSMNDSFPVVRYLMSHVVNTGFTNRSDPAQALDPITSLCMRESYFFWVEVGVPDPRSIEVTPTGLPTFSESVRLKVAIVPITGELAIDNKAAVGELELSPNGSVLVVSQPARITDTHIERDLLQRRLLFPILAEQAGLSRFRCNIYYEQILVQSRLISARVTERSRQFHQALRSELDYTLSGTLNPSYLKQLTPHQMSLLLATTEKTFSFSFFGGAGTELVKREATFDVLELKDVIGQARGILRRVAWGDEEDWQSTKGYRYVGQASFAQLKDDLISLAIRGYRLYDSIIDRMTGSRDKSLSLQQIMRIPGLVQIAIAESPRQHLPATLFYDYRLETGIESTSYKICPGFLQALDDDAPLEKSDCFQGRCKSRNSLGEDRVICPSGFWGFRHELGMPLSLTSSLDAPATITFEKEPQMVAGVSTDPAFTLWTGHEQILRQLRQNLDWTCAANRADLFALLKKSKPHVVYFYCHGGITRGVPYIQVGPPTDYVITRDNFRNESFNWDESWPLVFINGCRTADLDPSKALELVSACIQSSASGVVGTEITLFEPLACAFAEEFMRRFLVGVSVGEAIRGARLALLKQNNPLGLVYIPYALASLKLVGTNLQ